LKLRQQVLFYATFHYYFVFIATSECKEVVLEREYFPTLQTTLQIIIVIYYTLKLFANWNAYETTCGI